MDKVRYLSIKTEAQPGRVTFIMGVHSDANSASKSTCGLPWGYGEYGEVVKVLKKASKT